MIKYKSVKIYHLSLNTQSYSFKLPLITDFIHKYIFFSQLPYEYQSDTPLVIPVGVYFCIKV